MNFFVVYISIFVVICILLILPIATVQDTERITAFIRRIIALRRTKKFITKYNNSYSLKNKNVTLIYSYRNKSIACMNLKDRSQYFKVNWKQLETRRPTHSYYDTNPRSYYNRQTENTNLANLFALTFDRICMIFNDKTNFKDILNVFVEVYKTIHPGQDPFENTTDSEKSINEQKEEIKLININKATLEEIKKLPGINIITAKRIIKYIKDNNGFKSQQEFYEKFKIKPHFRKQLNDLIYVDMSPSNTFNYDIFQSPDISSIIENVEQIEIQKNNSNNDRIIDL